MEEHDRLSDGGAPSEPTPEEQLRRELAAAVAAYRAARLAAEPLVPPELVAGETVAAIDASLDQARGRRAGAGAGGAGGRARGRARRPRTDAARPSNAFPPREDRLRPRALARHCRWDHAEFV